MSICLVALAMATTVSLPHPATAQGRVDLTLTLVPNSYYVEAKAGQDNRFYLEVKNTGTTRLTQIVLSSDRPEGWTITFDPPQIVSIDHGGVQTINVNIRPPGTVTKGQYQVSFIAASADIRTVQTAQVRVASASYWLWAGVGLAVIVIGTFVIIFLRMGRRG